MHNHMDKMIKYEQILKTPQKEMVNKAMIGSILIKYNFSENILCI